MTARALVVGLLALLPLAAAAQPAAEVVLVTGRVTAAAGGAERSLGSGDAVNTGDTLTVAPNSYANLRFADGGRVLLRPNTVFVIESYRFAAAAAGEDVSPKNKTARAGSAQHQAFFRLVNGGFRAISGLIRGDAKVYKVATPVVTVGIRGTDYEVQTCERDCPTPENPRAQGGAVQVASLDLAALELAQADAPKGGLVVATNDGTVALQTPRGEYLVKTGEVAFATEGGQVFKLPVVPDILLYNRTESPEDCD